MGIECAVMMLRATLLVFLAGRAAGHGAMVYPRPRNSIDAFVVPPAEQKGYGFKGSCANITGAPCHNGQSAFWYSQGEKDRVDHGSGFRCCNEARHLTSIKYGLIHVSTDTKIC